MSRPKGSKNKKTIIKKIVDSSSTEKIKKTLQEARKKKKSWTKEQKARFSHVLILEYPYFIQATSTCYVLKQFVDKKDDNGEYRQPIPMCYAGRLADILKISADRFIRIPANVEECENNIERIYSMIDARTENKKPCELFEEYKTAQELKSRMLQ